MKTLLLLAGITAGLAHAEEAALAKVPAPPVAGRNLWLASMTALATANALDVHSSWGKHELNPALAGPTGRFGRDGALIKLGLQGGLMGIEYLITRGHPSGKLYRAFSFINFGASAATAGVAVHNYSVPRPR
jgi:hypothetical protein